MSAGDDLRPDPARSENTTATGATVGAAVGLIVSWFLETYTAVVVPDPVQGAVVLVFVYLISRFLPAR